MKESEVQQLLPLGTIVTLKDGIKMIMIVGRFQKAVDIDTDKLFDYSAVYYPEGILEAKNLFLFNHSDVKKIYHLGYLSHDEDQFKEFAVSKLREMDMLDPESEQAEMIKMN